MLLCDNLARLQNAALKTFQPLSRCQVILTKGLFYILSKMEFKNFSFWVLKILVFQFIANWVFVFCCYLSWFFCHFSFVNNLVLFFFCIGVFEFCPNWIYELSHFEFRSSVTIWVKYYHNWSFVGENSLLIKKNLRKKTNLWWTNVCLFCKKKVSC